MRSEKKRAVSTFFSVLCVKAAPVPSDMSKLSLAELEAACLRHENAIVEHTRELKRLTPLLATARWAEERRQPSSFIEINGDQTPLRFVEQKHYAEDESGYSGEIFIMRPIERANTVRFLIGQAGNDSRVDASALGIGTYHYPSYAPWSSYHSATFTHNRASGWGGWQIDFEIAENSSEHPSGRAAFRVKEVRYNQEPADEEDE